MNKTFSPVNGLKIVVISLLSLSFSSISKPATQSTMFPSVMGIYDSSDDFFMGTLYVVPIDTQYMSQAVWNLLDSLGADSVKREFPAYGPGDTLFVRPDGKQVRLPDLSRLYLIHFADSINYETFQASYNAISSTSSVWPAYIGVNDYVPSDLDPANQRYLFPKVLGLDTSLQAIDAVTAWDYTTGDSSQNPEPQSSDPSLANYRAYQ